MGGVIFSGGIDRQTSIVVAGPDAILLRFHRGAFIKGTMHLQKLSFAFSRRSFLLNLVGEV